MEILYYVSGDTAFRLLPSIKLINSESNTNLEFATESRLMCSFIESKKKKKKAMWSQLRYQTNFAEPICLLTK